MIKEKNRLENNKTKQPNKYIAIYFIKLVISFKNHDKVE